MNTLGKGLAAVGVLLGVAYGFEFYSRYEAESFCRSVPETETRAEIVARANSQDMFVNPLDAGANSVLVFNHRAPMWRYACNLEFKAGKVSNKSVFAAD